MTENDKFDHMPRWVDMARLCHEICASSTTVETWAAKGILPPAAQARA